MEGKPWKSWKVRSHIHSMRPPLWMTSRWYESLPAPEEENSEGRPTTGEDEELFAPRESEEDISLPEKETSRRDVIKEHWDFFVEQLYETEKHGAESKIPSGYERLRKQSDKLKGHLQKLETKVQAWRDRKTYLNFLFEVYANKLLSLTEAAPKWPITDMGPFPVSLERWFLPSPPTAEKEELKVAEVFGHIDLAHQPLASAFRVGTTKKPGEPLDQHEGWKWREISYGNNTEDESSSRWRIAFHPTPQHLRGEGMDFSNLLGSSHQRTNSFSTERRLSASTTNRSVSLVVTPDSTWLEVLQQIKRKHGDCHDHWLEESRNADLLDFRCRMLENVLYRFDVFGSVEKMSEEEADELARSGDPSLKGGGPNVKWVEEVVKAGKKARKGEISYNRTAILREAGMNIGLGGENLANTVQTNIELADLYPYQSRSGGNPKGNRTRFADEMIRRCKKYLERHHKNEERNETN